MRHQNLDWEPKRNVRFREYIVVAEVVVVVVVNKLRVTLRYFRVMHIFVVHLLGHHRTYAHTHFISLLCIVLTPHATCFVRARFDVLFRLTLHAFI